MRSIAAAVLAIAAVAGDARAAEPTCREPTVIIHAEALSDADKRTFEKRLRTVVSKVCAWWGATFDSPYTVNIEDSRGPSMALVPAWHGHHGTMLFRSGDTRRGHSAIIHEVTHVFAPNANRFLAEGLAVYAQEHLGGQSAYPNFGRDLHEAATSFAAASDLTMLDAIATPKGLRGPDRVEELKAYVVAGSFVRFLIETQGLAKFRVLYAKTPMVPGKRMTSDPARWQGVYGASLEQLEKRWKEFIANR